MSPWRLNLTLFGHPVVNVELGGPDTHPPPAADPPAPPPPTDAPGPVTDRRTPPITSIGFQSKRHWADGREYWGSPR